MFASELENDRKRVQQSSCAACLDHNVEVRDEERRLTKQVGVCMIIGFDRENCARGSIQNRFNLRAGELAKSISSEGMLGDDMNGALRMRVESDVKFFLGTFEYVQG